MALGEIISEVRGQVTSTKICPFDSAGQGVKYEVTVTAEHRGRLSGREVGTGYFVFAPDGTGKGTAYSVLTTSTEETVLIEEWGMSVPLGPGRRRTRTTVTFRTTSERLAWLNTTIGAFEAESDLSTMEIVGKNYEWV